MVGAHVAMCWVPSATLAVVTGENFFSPACRLISPRVLRGLKLFGNKRVSVNIDQLEWELPNGFHDALLRTYWSDPAERRAEFVLDLWVGDLHSAEERERERRRPARLELLELAYLVTDRSDPAHPVPEVSPVQIDLCGPDDDAELARQRPSGGFAGRFFVTEWNGFIHFSAGEARLTWLEVD